MNYLRIANQNKITEEDLMLIGSSTKRGQSNKIGMFGSGWKYALAWLMRNDCTPRIFSSTEEIIIDTKVVLHRDTPVSVITVNGRDTSLTVDMGPLWKGWMALREIISNAIDEGEFTIDVIKDVDIEFKGVTDRSVVYIPMNGRLESVMNDYDHYFSYERTPDYENEHGQLFINNDLQSMTVYRHGIKCDNWERKGLTDVNLYNLSINESRLAAESSIDHAFKFFIRTCDNTNVIYTLLKQDYLDWLPINLTTSIKKCLVELIRRGYRIGPVALKAVTEASNTPQFDLIIPNRWYRSLQDEGLLETLFSGNTDFIRTDKFDIIKLKYHLSMFNIDIECQSGMTRHKKVFRDGNIFCIKDDISMTEAIKGVLQELPVSLIQNIAGVKE